jgi:hypothetical protein
MPLDYGWHCRRVHIPPVFCARNENPKEPPISSGQVHRLLQAITASDTTERFSKTSVELWQRVPQQMGRRDGSRSLRNLCRFHFFLRDSPHTRTRRWCPTSCGMLEKTRDTMLPVGQSHRVRVSEIVESLDSPNPVTIIAEPTMRLAHRMGRHLEVKGHPIAGSCASSIVFLGYPQSGSSGSRGRGTWCASCKMLTQRRKLPCLCNARFSSGKDRCTAWLDGATDSQ